MLLCRSQLATAATLPSSSSSLTLWESSDVTAAANSLSLFWAPTGFTSQKGQRLGLGEIIGHYHTQLWLSLDHKNPHLGRARLLSIERKKRQSFMYYSAQNIDDYKYNRTRKRIYPGFEPKSRDLFLKSPSSKA